VDILKELQMVKDINEMLQNTDTPTDLLWACDSHGKGQIFKYLDAWVHTWTTALRETKENVAGQHYRRL